MSIWSVGKDVLVQAAGWILVLAGIAGMILPGPGLPIVLAGIAVLATQYTWARRNLSWVKRCASRVASSSVRTWPRLLAASASSLLFVALGVLWFVEPPAPAWWPVADHWWLWGGWKIGASLVGSGIFGLALLAYSYFRFPDHTN